MIAPTDTMTAPTAADLRAEADRMERDAAAVNRGKVFVSGSGFTMVHDGSATDERISVYYREASEAEVETLRTIPEFAAALDRVRGS